MKDRNLQNRFYPFTLDKFNIPLHNKAVDKGKPVERQGRKAMGLSPPKDMVARPPAEPVL
jgi:hypothetical protein